jgi:hypothetical protein
MTKDDKAMNLKMVDEAFKGKQVIVTEKLDGENCTIYSDGFTHARSLDSAHHPSRSYVKGLASSISWAIPPGWRLCGENLYAVHSIEYTSLPSFFCVYSVWDENNFCAPWKDTVAMCKIRGLATVPVIWEGEYNAAEIEAAFTRESAFGPNGAEGYVIRVAGDFPFNEFSKSVAKYVRKNHVQTDEHWMRRMVVLNGLEGKSGDG